MRLQKYMAYCGIASRRKSEELIKGGQVKVNGLLVTELGTRIDPEKDIILVADKLVKTQKLVYILLNKPSRIISSCSDSRGRKTVIDILPKEYKHLYPVGRLDWDSEGLVFLTNDGPLAYRVTHPRFGVEKSYLVTTDGTITEKELELLAKGVELEDGMTAPAKVHLVRKSKDRALVELTIKEGRNRQIRRMFHKLSLDVYNLKRIRIGPLLLGRLKTGEHRPLEDWELEKLQKI